MWIILAALLLFAFLSTARFATPAQQAATPARVQRIVFWCWLVLGPMAIWMAWDAGGPVWDIVMLGVTAFVLVDSRRKGWA
mgnify:CR=1 FL=1